MKFGIINHINYANFDPHLRKSVQFLFNKASLLFNRAMSFISAAYYQVTILPRSLKIESAAYNGSLATINLYLTKRAVIFEQSRGKAVVSAALNDDLAMIQALLANGPISEEDRGLALTWAALHGDLAIVQALLANGPIPGVYRFQAIANADARGHLAILAALGVNPHVPLLDVHSGDRDKKTKNSIINFYTHQGPITTVEINEAYNNFVTYLETPGATAKETASKQKAFHALVDEKKSW